MSEYRLTAALGDTPPPSTGHEGSHMVNQLVRRATLALGLAAVVAAALVAPVRASAAAPAYTLADVGAYGGEPSITSDSNGVLYYTSPSTVHVYRSADQGATWTQMAPDPDNNSGDNCLATDESNSLYWCNLASMTASRLPLQADVWKDTSNQAATKTPEICTTVCGWVHGAAAPAGTSCPGGTSCQPFGVDRQWTAASLLGTGSTNTAEVALMYHDFYGPSEIWVNVSKDGGATFGSPVPVIASCTSAGCAPGAVVAQGYQMCNTVPTGVAIVPQKLPNGTANPHAGRIYVSWIAADPTSPAQGCNITQAQAFHTVWLAYSDDGGATWTSQGMVDQGIGHDASTPFAAFTLDNNGNPYVAFAAPASGSNPATCTGESTAGTVQGDPTCDYHMWVVACTPGATSGTVTSNMLCGDGLSTTIPGAASVAHEVDSGMTTAGTDLFPTIGAGDPGKVDVSWLRTTTIVPTDAAGKFLPGGCAGSAAGPNPPYPPTPCPWNLFEGQSLNLNITGAPASSWVNSQLTSTPMHVGDICNLGIACGPTSNRHLLDFNQETIDPTTGCAHISYPDDNTVNLLRAANQVAGPGVIGGLSCGPAAALPEAPLAAVLLGGGALAAAVAVGRRRQRGALAS
ncbi:MAG: hypothetical protein ACYDAC_10510 [Candidatus Dormibacteria bacterium]